MTNGARLFFMTLLCVWMLCGAGCGDARAQTPATQDELYLEVTLNGEATGIILRFTQGKKGLRSTGQNLRDLGLDPQLFGVAGRDEFDLDEANGLSYTYDAARQTISLQVADALRVPFELAARQVRQAMPASAARGALLNYDAYLQLGKAWRQSSVHELRYFDQDGVFSSSGVLNLTSGDQTRRAEYVRFDSYWTRSDPATLQTWQVGDVITSSLPWTRSMRLGGVQWRKNFDLRPDLLTFPVAALKGSAVVPTALSLYVNGVQQIQTEVPSGPFVISQMSGLNGAGQATIVTRDAAGRTVSTTLPLYVDTRLLSVGLLDYGIELGAPRRNYSIRSFSYASSPALNASLRYGASDALTLEAHAEAGRGVVNAGGGVLWRLGQFGVVNATAAASAGSGAGGGAVTGTAAAPVVLPGSGRGWQGGLGYQYIRAGFSVDAQTLRATPRYSDLATTEGSPLATRSDRFSLNLALSTRQSLGLSLISFHSPLAEPARIASVSYSATLPGGAFFSVSAFRDRRVAGAHGVSANLSFAFDNRVAASANMAHQQDRRTDGPLAGQPERSRSRSYTVSRAPEFGGGLGWVLQKGNLNDTRYDQAQLQYLGRSGQLSAITLNNGSTRSTALDLSGALVLMDGSLQTARQTGGGFALVSTDGVPNVPVWHENRPIGVTDSGGHLLVPNLLPYAANQIGIDVSGLPVDARISRTRQIVTPRLLTGVLARFPVERYTAASIIVHGEDGKPLAPGLAVLHTASGAASVLGYDGMAFIDNLQDDNVLLIGSGERQCAVRFPYQYQKGSGALPVIGPLVCRPPGKVQ